MYKILISGYYGFNNIGDESILTAVVENLKERLPNIEITVLSQNPVSTEKRYGVKSVNRKSPGAIISAMRRCDLLISGGGSLLQDVTSKKSILYYLFIMWLARLLGKPFFVYSQGIGPITSKWNRKLTAKTLLKAGGIVVRDETSKEFLVEIGIPADRVVVTADPVLRSREADLGLGMEILQKEGFVPKSGSQVIGFAIKERRLDSSFVTELITSMDNLLRDPGMNIVLIPFHFQEDMPVAEAILEKLREKTYGDRVCCIRHKYLTEEMLSIIGNMDLLVGVRLHALIHASIMGVPMIGISYDPKINSFLHSVGLRAMCSIYDFNSEYFMEEFARTVEQKEIQKAKVGERVKVLRESLDTNEEMIAKLRQAQGK